MAHAAIAGNQVFAAAAIGTINEGSERFGVAFGSGKKCGGAGIAKKCAGGLIVLAEEFAVGFSGKQKKLGGLPRFKQAFGNTETVDIAGAAQVEIQGTGGFRDTETVLDQA